jgi:hypothetical protein
LNHGNSQATLFSHYNHVTDKEYKNTGIFTNQFSTVQVVVVVVVKRRRRRRTGEDE